MNFNRRSFLKGIAGLGASLILPPTIGENVEDGKRIWALGGVPAKRDTFEDADYSSLASTQIQYAYAYNPARGIPVEYVFDAHDAVRAVELQRVATRIYAENPGRRDGLHLVKLKLEDVPPGYQIYRTV